MDILNLKTFLKRVDDNNDILINVDDFCLKTLIAIIFYGRQQLKLEEKITFKLTGIKELLELEDSEYTYHRIENAIFYLTNSYFKCKLPNNCERIFYAIKAIEKPIDDIYFNKEWKVEIDSFLREHDLTPKI